MTWWQKLLGTGKDARSAIEDSAALIESTKAGIYEKRQSNPSSPSRIYKADDTTIEHDDRIIIILPGSNVKNDILDTRKNKYISGTARVVTMSGYRLMPVAYSSYTEISRTNVNYYGQRKHNDPPEFSWNRDVQDIVDHLIRPRIPDIHDQDGDERAASLMQCFRSFRNIKVFGNSYGGIMVQQMNHAMNALMAIKGYDADETGFLLPQIMTAGVATICHAENESHKTIPKMSAVGIKAFNDAFLVDEYDVLGDREEKLAVNLLDDKKYGMIRFGSNQIGFYGVHNIDPNDSAFFRNSHALLTYLPHRKPDDTSAPQTETPFEVFFRNTWSAITTQDAAFCMQHAGILDGMPPSIQWQRVQQSFAHPMQMVLDHAAQSTEFTTLMDQTFVDDRNLEDAGNTLPTPPYAEHYRRNINTNDLRREINNRVPEPIIDYLMNNNFEPFGQNHYRLGIPSVWANEDGCDDIKEASMVLFRTKATGSSKGWYGTDHLSGDHDICALSYRGVSIPRYLVVEKKVYENMIKPFQHEWQQNPDEDIMSIARRVHNQFKESAVSSSAASPQKHQPASPSSKP